MSAQLTVIVPIWFFDRAERAVTKAAEMQGVKVKTTGKFALFPIRGMFIEVQADEQDARSYERWLKDLLPPFFLCVFVTRR